MSAHDFSQAALVLIGHGSTQNAASSAPVRQHAAALRGRGLFGQVLECFWKVEPHVSRILDQVRFPQVFAVPFFVSDGYFTEEVLPRELGLLRPDGRSFDRVQHRPTYVLHYTRPVGTHPAMTDVLLRRARDVVAAHPHPAVRSARDLTLFIAGHGTERNDTSRRIIERQAERIRARGDYADVHPAFMEEQPRISDCLAMARTPGVVMVPFFMSDGLHTAEDIPMLLGEPEEEVRARLQRGEPTFRNPTERQGKVLWYTTAIGSEPLMEEVILERVREGEKE